MANTDPRTLLAAGKVDTTGAILSAVGNFSVTKGAAGISTINLPAPGVPEGEEVLLISANTAGQQANIVGTSAIAKTVNTATFAGPGTLTDGKFSFEVWSTNPRV